MNEACNPPTLFKLSNVEWEREREREREKVCACILMSGILYVPFEEWTDKQTNKQREIRNKTGEKLINLLHFTGAKSQVECIYKPASKAVDGA